MGPARQIGPRVWLICLVSLVGSSAYPIAAKAAACDLPDAVRVREVLDGDSFVLEDGHAVRLIGVNAPDYGKGAQPNQPLAREAHQFLARLVRGRCVTLTTEADPTDRYGRLLAHVVLPDGRSVEELLIQQGLAWTIAISPNVAWTAKLKTAEARAQLEQRGIWNIHEYQPTPAALLKPSHAGFRLIEGTVQRVGRSQYAYYFDLTSHTSLLIARADWDRYFQGDPNRFLYRRLVARGWLSTHNESLRMRVHHPAMLTFDK